MFIRTFAIAAAAATFSLAGLAQVRAGHAGHHPPAAASAADSMPMPGQADAMAHMDEHMKAMQEMHEKMAQAQTPEERSALIAEQMKAMQDGIAMMDKDALLAMGANGMPVKGKGGVRGKPPNMSMRQAMLEKRMDMMQSMMQMMMDHMQQPAQMGAPSDVK
jgi:uncharacterized protein YecA (UPF0149 family)